MATDRYINICNILSDIFCSENNLNLIKEHFRDGIDSARRSDRTTNLSQLITILEKRDILSRENITPLRYIAEILQRHDVIQLIDSNGLRLQEEPVLHEPLLRNRVLPEVNSDPVERVYDVICMEIGQKWKEFARKLKIPEGFIDELEHSYTKISERVREILDYHISTCDRNYWKVKLCRALEKARRRDLSNEVENIFASHGLM